MKIPTKKLASGFEMPVLGLGTWMVGGDKQKDPNNDDDAQVNAIRQVIELGINHIDMAENYAEGHAEEIVGQAIEGYDRKKLFLVSKVDKRNLSYKNLLEACEKSLNRLNTDYLDLYLIHAPNDDIPIEESLKAMEKLVAKKMIKNFGVSNFTTKRLKDAQSKTSQKIVTNQVYYNLTNREPEKDGLLEYCQTKDCLLTAYRPINQAEMELPDILTKMARKYGKKPFQIVLNWLVSQKNVVTITKMLKPKHAEENLGCLSWKLESQDIELLREKYPNQEFQSEHLGLR